MEASGLFDRFDKNLALIRQGLKANVALDRTALQTALPLEFRTLADTLNREGAFFSLQRTDLGIVEEFAGQYEAKRPHIMEAMQRQLDDKRSVIRNEEGTVLVKEMLIRRLEYIDQAAVQFDRMMWQGKMGRNQYLQAINSEPISPNKTFRSGK